MRAAVVGHVEWVEFVSVERVPRRGEIVHAFDSWQEPGGGGAGAAVQLQKLTGDSTFFTALGDDEIGSATKSFLVRSGVRVEAATRREPSRRAITFVDPGGERTITVLGSRLAPAAGDALPWELLRDVDAAYFSAGDVAALRAAREARVLVATTRILSLLAEAGVYLDAVVGSAVDQGEAYQRGDIEPEPGLAVMTEGEDGGFFETGGAGPERFDAAVPERPVVDRYGAGDCFAAGLTYALGRGDRPPEAVAFAARCGAAVVTGRGPYERQLTAADLSPVHDRPADTRRGE